ncbi:cytochrome P450 4V2-like [Topomyia yanbarensis]|uniref:cytochrome P450 4V2-like n=1 Tax=Topomyia yanbarensis TaxID=2498891 RepID=UPI00273ACA2E|nr:cytochrome P450 4V2-like [Topomyia yanbarensis]
MWLFLVAVIVLLLAIIVVRGGEYLALYGRNDIERFGAVVGLFRNFDRLFRTRFGPIEILGSCHPDVIQQVLSNVDCLEKPFFYRFTGLENGLLSAKHQLWKKQRKTLNSSFNLKILYSFIPIFESCCRKMIEDLNELAAAGPTVNIMNCASKCTLEMVFGTTIGIDVTNQSNEKEILGYVERLFNLVSRRMLTLHLYFDWVYRFTKDYREDRKLRTICIEKANELIDEQKKRISSRKDCNRNCCDELGSESHYRKPRIFIEQLLEESNEEEEKFSVEEIYHNAYTIILAGNDTSALSVAHSCLFLAMYPHIQDKVYAELRNVYPCEDSPITPDNLKQLEYMEMFIKETLRLCPVVPNIARQAVNDVWIDGKRVPKGSIFVVSFYALHRRKDIWGPDAYQFDPENFHPDRTKGRHPYGYLPFSGGPRNCIGWRYAMISIKVMLIYLLRTFKLSTDLRQTDLRYRFDLTLKLAFEHLVRLERR